MQLTKGSLSLKIIFTKIYISSVLEKKLLNNYNFYIKTETENSDRLLLAIFIYNYIPIEKSLPIISILLNSVDEWNFFYEDYEYSYQFIKFLQYLNCEVINHELMGIGIKIFAPLILSISDIDDLFSLINLIIKKFKIDLVQIFREDNFYNFNKYFSNLIDEKIDEDIEYLWNLIMQRIM